MKVEIKRSDYNRMYEYALKELPNEACGLIAGIDRPDGTRVITKVYLLTNIDNTNEHFSIDPKEQLDSIKDMRVLEIKPLGNWHSHPESPSRPSEEDKRLANDSKASYLILSLIDDNPVLNAFHIDNVDGEKKVRKEELLIVEDI